MTGEDAYAFQCHFVLDPEKSFSIKNYKSIQPVTEPTINSGWLDRSWEYRNALVVASHSFFFAILPLYYKMCRQLSFLQD
jgi:hypothetical protein